MTGFIVVLVWLWCDGIVGCCDSDVLVIHLIYVSSSESSSSNYDSISNISNISGSNDDHSNISKINTTIDSNNDSIIICIYLQW